MSARDLWPIAALVLLLALVPLWASNVLLNFLVTALIVALAAQGWNLLGGFGGQFSFGHAAFFGTGAYATAVLQVRGGVNAWAAWMVPRGRYSASPGSSTVSISGVSALRAATASLRWSHGWLSSGAVTTGSWMVHFLRPATCRTSTSCTS